MSFRFFHLPLYRRNRDKNAPKRTNAKSMSFAILIPDWNSLDSVRHAHSELEAAALVFFALLVLFDVLAHLSKDEKRKTLLEKIGLCFFAVAILAEIAAYPYGQRNDELSANMIGSLSEKAKEALTDSRTALTNSGTALTKSGEAVTNADLANDAAAKAEQKADSVEKQAKELERQLLAAGKQLETLRAKQGELVASLTPRPQLAISGPGLPSIAPLRQFAGTNVFLEYFPTEVADIGSLGGVLDTVRWPVTAHESPSIFWGGVTIWTHLAPIEPRTERLPNQDEERSHLAAKALCEFLTASGWDTRVQSGSRTESEPTHVPANAIRVWVGKKPQPFFDPDWMKEMHRREKEALDHLKQHGIAAPLCG